MPSTRKALKIASNGSFSDVKFPKEWIETTVKRLIGYDVECKSIYFLADDALTTYMHVMIYFSANPMDTINKYCPCVHGDIFMCVEVDISKEVKLKEDYDAFFDQYTMLKMLRGYGAYEIAKRKGGGDFRVLGKYVDEKDLVARVARKLKWEVGVKWKGGIASKTGPTKSVLEYNVSELHVAKEAQSAKLASAIDAAEHASIRAKVSAFKKYISSLDKADMVRRWDTLLNLCNELGDRQGAAVAERRMNKARECQAFCAREMDCTVPSSREVDDCEPPSGSMSAAARKHRAALKKHGLGSRQETRARREMVEFDSVLMMTDV